MGNYALITFHVVRGHKMRLLYIKFALTKSYAY